MLVQGVVVRDERTGVGAGGDRHENRSVHLHESAPVQEPADAADDPAALHEGVGDLRVGDEVQVALAVTSFDIPQSVPLLGQGPHTLGQDGQGVGLNSGLPGAGSHHVAVHPEEIAQVEVLNDAVSVAQDVLSQHGLYHA